MKKKCVFYGNCQVFYNIYDFLNKNQAFANEYESIRYVNHDRDQFDSLSNINLDDIKNCDLFIHQPLDKKHGCFATDNIKQFLKKECLLISFPYVYNSALYSIYFESASTRWSIGSLINCGWLNIFELIIQDKNIEFILNLYDENKLNFYFDKRFEICISSLKQKEKNCEIKVSDFILNNYKKYRIFRTQNHLSNFFVESIGNEILKILNITSKINFSNSAIDNVIDQDCVYDMYNKKHYNFLYDTSCITNNDITKNKIKHGFQFFNTEMKKYSLKDFSFFEIKNEDPEKFK